MADLKTMFAKKPAESAQVATSSPEPSEAKAEAKTSAGNPFAAAKPAAKNPLAALKPATIPTQPAKPAPAPTADAGADGGFSLDDLADSMEPGLTTPTRSQFADETPATKPTRDLPEGLDKQQRSFVDLLDGMYEIVHDPELLGNVVKSMMVELKAQPQYEKLLSPSDVRLVVRAARESMGIARVKKTEAKAKRGGGSKKSSAVDADMLGDLKDLGISFE